MRIAPAIELTPVQQSTLEAQARSRSLPARVVERSRILLLAAAGKQDKEIARSLHMTPKKVSRWRKRFLQLGLAGLEKDAPRPGRTHKIDARLIQRVVDMTTRQKPPKATHWSTRTMAEASGISEASVRRIWRAYGLKPHLMATFKVSSAPEFAEKWEDIVGLYLNPREHAMVLCPNGRSQIQALDRTQSGLPLKPGHGQTVAHDYKRNSMATLFAALDATNPEVFGTRQERHRHQEWLRFLRLVDQTTARDRELHLICDNYTTYKHPKVQRWLERHPRFHMHFTPTSASWLILVERFFPDLKHTQVRPGVLRDLEELIVTIESYTDRNKRHPKPFIWTARAGDILEKVKRARQALHKRHSA